MIMAKIIGDRLRSYRNQKNWSQEQLAEYAGLHSTYIGQLERGEKNATIESISKVAAALGVSLSTLFENISAYDTDDIPSKCYELVQKQSVKDQKYLLEILDAIVNYKES